MGRIILIFFLSTIALISRAQTIDATSIAGKWITITDSSEGNISYYFDSTGNFTSIITMKGVSFDVSGKYTVEYKSGLNVLSLIPEERYLSPNNSVLLKWIDRNTLQMQLIDNVEELKWKETNNNTGTLKRIE